MLDNFDRNISYIRISVTDKCNMRCIYCYPTTENNFFQQKDLLSLKEITETVQQLVPFGINKVRLTGGEPLLRNDITDIVKNIANIDGIEDIGLTTNGTLLKKYAKVLYNSGLKRVNISLDSIDADKYNQITGGNLHDVISGIDEAIKIGFSPIKINCVKTSFYNQEEKRTLEDFCKKRNLLLRYITQMDLSEGTFYEIEGGDGGKCNICNRVRLLSNGDFISCLFSDETYSIRNYGISKAFELAVNNKPPYGKKNKKGSFLKIGG